jgi:hypothetical protein
VRHNHLHNEEFRAVPLGERGGPLNGLLGCFGPIGPDHHAPHRGVLKVIFHRLIFLAGE